MRLLPMNPAARTPLGRLPLRIYGMALGLLGLVLMSLLVVVQPKNRAMAEVRQEIQDSRASLQLLEVEMSKLGTVKRRVSQLQQALSAFEDRLPRQGEIDVILREVWVIADAAGLKTQRIKTEKGRQQDGYKVLPISMNLRGPFEGLYRFLLSLERLPGIMKVESLRVTSPQNAESDGVEAVLVLGVFCKP